MSAPPPRRALPVILLVLGAALAGGLVALLVARATGLAGSTTTVEAPATTAAAAPAATGGLDATALWQAAAPSVVTVAVRPPGGGVSSGTGFVVGPGEIATAAHVVATTTGAGEEASTVLAEEVWVRLADGDQARATIRGVDPASDVALLEVDPATAGLPVPLALGDPGSLRVGDPVALIGSPLGARQAGSLAPGVVAGVRRRVDVASSAFLVPAIQVDAAVNPGSSGSPVLDAAGDVVGLLVQSGVNGDGVSGQGIGLAVPADVVSRALDGLRADGTVAWPWFGAALREVVPGMAALGVAAPRGVLVNDLAVGGPAAAAGLRAAGTPVTWALETEPLRPAGDVIVGVDGAPVASLADFWSAILPHRPGDVVQLDVVSPDGERQVAVTLGARPQQPVGAAATTA